LYLISPNSCKRFPCHQSTYPCLGRRTNHEEIIAETHPAFSGAA
jgi:hypothetical protein